MAVQNNAFLTYDAIGNKEDINEVIKLISPEDTPFLAHVGKGVANAVMHEWQTDSLSDADTTNAVLEGDVVDGTASSPTTREKNYCQISRRDAVVSTTQEKVKKAGRKSEMSYQIANRGKELRRDIEAIVVSNQGWNAGAAGTARKTRSLESWLSTNVDRDAGGANAASGSDPATDSGTTRAFTETMLKNVVQSSYQEGATPQFLMVGPYNKGVVSNFAGRTSARQSIEADKIQAARISTRRTLATFASCQTGSNGSAPRSWSIRSLSRSLTCVQFNNTSWPRLATASANMWWQNIA
jgi:hypothetical protein